MTLDEIRETVALCKFQDWQILVKMDGDRPYLQIYVPNGTDIVTGETIEWTGRKWLLSVHMVKNEIVATAFKAVVTAMEHEIREAFTYKDAAIFNPHVDPDRMVEFIKSPGAPQERENVAFAA